MQVVCSKGKHHRLNRATERCAQCIVYMRLEINTKVHMAIAVILFAFELANDSHCIEHLNTCNSELSVELSINHDRVYTGTFLT